MSANDRTLKALRSQQLEVGQLVDGTTRELSAMWAAAWDEVSDALDEAVLSGFTDRGRLTVVRRREVLRLLTEQITALSVEANETTVEAARALAELAGPHQDALMRTQLPAHLSVGLEHVDRYQLTAIVERTAQQITSRTRFLNGEAQARMRRVLMRSVMVGDNPRKAASQMAQDLRTPFDGGLVRANVIARTELLDAYRTAGKATQDANSDVLAGWRWVAALGPRTCPSCLRHHGALHPLAEQGPHDHPQGRCARVPETKSWADLGFHGIKEPPGALREGDGVRWLEAQDEGTQLQVMGRGRLEAWKAGGFPPGDWSVKRRADGWRDSYVVGKPKGGLDSAPRTGILGA